MSRWTRLRQWRPSRLGLKLFVAILSVNVAIAASVFLAVSYSIDRGFLEYLNQAQERRATLLPYSTSTSAARLTRSLHTRDDMRIRSLSIKNWLGV